MQVASHPPCIRPGKPWSWSVSVPDGFSSWDSASLTVTSDGVTVLQLSTEQGLQIVNDHIVENHYGVLMIEEGDSPRLFIDISSVATRLIPDELLINHRLVIHRPTGDIVLSECHMT